MATSIQLDDLETMLALARADDWRLYDTVANRSTATDRATEELPSGMSSGGLVARNRELASLDRALWMARRGRSDVLVLRGDPGTGKSSLVQAAIGRASDVRNVALRGILYVDGTVPSGSWPQPIIDILDEHSSPEPEVGPDTPVVTAMVDALVSLSGHSLSPLLLSVDDAHLLPGWFTAALVEAVGSQLENMPIVLVLSASSLGITPMATDVQLGVSSYELRPLNVKQAKLLLDLRGDHMPTPRVLLELVQSTAGNPEALLDVCSSLDADELAGHRPLPDPLPLGAPLRDKFARRFGELPEATQDALSVVSAGRIPFDTLKRTLSDLGMSTDILKPAQEAGILVVSRDRIEFSHPIERSAVYWLSSEEARSRAHAALSQTLLDQDRVELGAYHASRGKTDVDNRLARLHIEAARIAIDRGSPTIAARHHEFAAAFAESNEAKAHHLVLAASLLMTVGRIDRALSHLDRATQLDQSDHLRGQAAYLEARARLSNDLDPEIADEMIAAADLCEGNAVDWAVMMLVDASACLLMTGSSSTAVAVAERARDLACAVGAHLEALAKTALAVAANRAGQVASDTPDLVATTDHLIFLTDRFRASPQLAWLTGLSLLESGQRGSALSWADWIERCADSAGDRPLAVVPLAVRGAEALYGAEIDAGVVYAQASVNRALQCGDQTLAAQTLGLLTGACAARGLYARGFAAGAQQFALSDDTARVPRVQTLVALAALDMQQGRTASAFAWLKAANDEFATNDDGAAVPVDHSVSIHWSLAYAELVVLSRSAEGLAPLAQAVESAQSDGLVSAWQWWIRALSASDVAVATSCFERAEALTAGMPYAQGRLRLSWGVRLAEWGQHGEARQQLEQSRARFASLHADGWEHLAERELGSLPERRQADTRPEAEEAPAPIPAEAEAEAEPAVLPAVSASGHPEWEIALLGSFSVEHEGRPVSLPNSLAVQALKIVTLRKRISVDELVELLWPDAHPGVGNRRLRNVLWRNRVSCGDLLCRDGNFICLAKEAVVDADAFRVAADRAIEAVATDSASDLVREALALYPGELLPGDHYVDWPTARREALAGLHMSLLDVLLDQAIGEGQTHEALGYLDRLIEADPYEERHYVRAAELHAAAGNVSRALSTLSRADRTLTDLGVGPSPMVERVRQKLAS